MAQFEQPNTDHIESLHGREWVSPRLRQFAWPIPLIVSSSVALFVSQTTHLHQAPFFFFIFSIGIVGWCLRARAAVYSLVFSAIWLAILFGLWSSDVFPYSASILRFAGFFINASLIVFLLHTRDLNEQKLKAANTDLESQIRVRDAENRKLAMIAKRTNNAVILTDKHGRIEWVNDGFTRISGYTFDEVVGYTPGSILQGPLTDAATIKEMRQSIRNGNGFHAEVVNYNKSGEPYWIRIDAQPIVDAAGEIVQFMAIEQDISEPKRIQQALQESEERYRNTFEQAAVGIAHVSLTGTWLRVNQRIVDILGYPAERLLESGLKEFTGTGDHLILQEKKSRLIQGSAERFSMEQQFIRADHTFVWVNLTVSLVRCQNHSPQYFIVVLEDINLRREMQQALFESEDRLRRLNEYLERRVAERTAEWEALVEAAPVGIWVSHDAHCHQLSSNRFARELFGLETEDNSGALIPWTIEDQVIHMNRGVQLTPDQLPLQQAAKRGEVVRNLEIDEIIPGHQPITLIGNAAPLFDVDQRIRGMIAVYVDITARRETEKRLEQLNSELEARVLQRTEELQQAKAHAEQANQAKGEFLSRMSHELRTPLNAVLGFAQVLKMGELNSRQLRQVEQIEKGGKHLLDMINEVLDFSRIDAGWLELSLTDVGLFVVLQEAIDLLRPLAEEKQIQIAVAPSIRQFLPVHVDHLRLRQVLINLLSNAIKYNRDLGLIEIDLVTNDDRILEVTIHNTGEGILPQDRNKLFRPFDRLGAERSEHEGTGLGLVVSQRLMQAMSGDLRLVEDERSGCTFRVTIPKGKEPLRQLNQNMHSLTTSNLEDVVS